MSVDTDIISTTDLRKWIEDETADVDDEICSVNNVCTNQAVVRVCFSCRCPHFYCAMHRDVFMQQVLPYGAPGFICYFCNKLVQFLGMEPLR